MTDHTRTQPYHRLGLLATGAAAALGALIGVAVFTANSDTVASAFEQGPATMDTCGDGLATGTATNPAGEHQDLVVQANFLDVHGVIIGQANQRIALVPPGARAAWQVEIPDQALEVVDYCDITVFEG